MISRPHGQMSKQLFLLSVSKDCDQSRRYTFPLLTTTPPAKWCCQSSGQRNCMRTRGSLYRGTHIKGHPYRGGPIYIYIYISLGPSYKVPEYRSYKYACCQTTRNDFQTTPQWFHGVRPTSQLRPALLTAATVGGRMQQYRALYIGSPYIGVPIYRSNTAPYI